MTNRECAICDELINADNPASDLDDEICAACDDDAIDETRDELRAAGIDPDDAPVIIAAEISRRI